MTEEQLNKLKGFIQLRIEMSEKSKTDYEKIEGLNSYFRGQVDALNSVLKDIEMYIER